MARRAQTNARAMCACLRLGLILSVLFLGLTTAAIPPDRTLHQLIRQQWQRDDGLPQNAIYCIAQDHDGFVWFGTENGLVRFDGVKTEVFTEYSEIRVPNNYVSTLLVTKDGAVWAATRTGGLSRYKDDKFEVPSAVFNEVEIYGLAESNAGIWLATDRGLMKWDGQSASTYGVKEGLSRNHVTALTVDPDGDVIVGTLDGDLYKFRNGRFEQLFLQKRGLAGSQVKAIVVDAAQGRMWAGYDGAGIFYFDKSGAHQLELALGDEKERINALHLDRTGTLWVATQTQGLCTIQNLKVIQLSSRQGDFPDDDILSIFEDREGLVWVGTHFAGVMRLHEGRAITVPVAASNPPVACLTEEDSETLWVGTRGAGLFKYSHCTFTPEPLGETAGLRDIEKYERADIRSLLKTAEGDLWVGTWGGLARRTPDGKTRFYTVEDGLTENAIASLFENGNEIWIGTPKMGICIYDKQTGQIRPKNGPEFLNTHLRSFAKDASGTIWIGTQNGLVKFEDGVFREVSIPVATNTSIRSIRIDTSGVMWLGTRDNGLLRMKDGEFHRLDAAKGLAHNRIYELLHAGEDLYLAGNQGIERVNVPRLEAVIADREKQINSRLYTKDDGLGTSECGGDSGPSALKTKDGTSWFGTRAGLTHFPNRLKPAAESEGPNVVIQRVRVDNRKLVAKQFRELLPGSSRLQFDYTALSLRNPKSVFFKHRLEGADGDWFEAGTDREAVYYNLKPGKYTFRVIACNDEGVWNQNGAALAFTVIPAFYQTALFRGGTTFLAGALLLALYRWRVRQMRGRTKELEKVVMDRTSELRLLNEELETRVISRTAEVRSAYENLQIELQERHEAEVALARSEARLRRIVDSGMVGILFWAKSGEITDANDTFLRMIGYSREDLETGAISWERLTPAEFLDRDAAALVEIQQSGVCTPFEKEYVRKDGTRVPILIGGASLSTDGDKGVCFVLDISKLKETEEQIRQLNLKLEARVAERTLELAQTNAQLAAEVQERKRVGVAVSAFSHLGQKLHAARTEKEAAAIVMQTAQSLIPHDVCTIELYDSEGHLVPVLETPSEGVKERMLQCSISVSIRNGTRVVGVIGLKNSQPNSFNYADANTLQALGDYCGGALERIHAEEARRETERRFSTFMTNAPALAWMKDAQFRYVFTNEMFQRFIGLPGALIEGKTDYDLWPDHVAFHMRNNDTETVKTQAKLETQEQLKRHDGEARTLLTLRFLFTTATGEQFVAGMAVDITEQKRAEEALHRLPQSIIEAQEAERRRVARELHDGVNQAIASVKFRIQTAEQQILRADPRWQETCNKSKEMLDSVLQQVRRLSRNLRPGELDDFGLVAAARSALQEFELRSGIHVRFTHSELSERLPGPLELSLYRIIQEALNNVEKHSGASSVEIELNVENEMVTLEITDDGCGFDMNEKRGPRSDGGLGLLHMRERASLVGGVFSMVSAPGQGVHMTIRVRIPQHEEVLN